MQSTSPREKDSSTTPRIASSPQCEPGAVEGGPTERLINPLSLQSNVSPSDGVYLPAPGIRCEAIGRRNSKVYVRQQGGVATVSLGERNIWDLADLRLLREISERLVHVRRCRDITVDMRSAQSLASGFFGLLHDLCKLGVKVTLLAPHRGVREMLWFRAFCEHVVDDCYRFVGESQSHVLHSARNQWRRKAQSHTGHCSCPDWSPSTIDDHC